MNEYAVRTKDLTKTFGSFTAVNKISVEVRKGEIFGFLGPNGAGKTTTIKMLCGLLSPTSGSGTIAGYDIRGDRTDIKKIIGYMSQKFSLYNDLTVIENIRFFGGVYGVTGGRLENKIDELTEIIQLDEIKNLLTADISLGWKQRLALACSILHEPDIIFLDEPTSGVAPDARRRFWNLITRLAANGVTVFVTTHYMDEAEHCDRLAFINRGEVIAIGTTSEIKDKLSDEIILEIESNRLLEALKILEKEKFITEIAPFGNTLHLTVEDEKSATTTIKNILSKSKITGVSIKRIQPSLEDVFVKMMKGQNA
ncbi:MAG: ABC transporter ATP-binding protein [Acidobacteria bacterium]|nr:ABC transporter ATP-binding protein [Acidobacteriota bacterium]